MPQKASFQFLAFLNWFGASRKLGTIYGFFPAICHCVECCCSCFFHQRNPQFAAFGSIGIGQLVMVTLKPDSSGQDMPLRGMNFLYSSRYSIQAHIFPEHEKNELKRKTNLGLKGLAFAEEL